MITWAENADIFSDIGFAFRTFLNRATSWDAAAGGWSISTASAKLAEARSTWRSASRERRVMGLE